GKYFFSPFTSNTAAGLSGISGSSELVRVPAGRPVALLLFFVARILLLAHVAGKGTAGRERAARRQVAERRHNAGNFLQPLRWRAVDAVLEAGQARDRVQEAAGVGVERRSEQGRDGGLLYLAARVHDNDAFGRFRH